MLQWVTGVSLWQDQSALQPREERSLVPWNFTLPGKVPPDPAKPTPVLSGEQAAFKEFETPWSLAGSGGGPTQPLGQEITFLHRRRTSQVSNPSGQLISLRGRAPPSTGSETPRLGFSQARPSEGMGVTALTCRPGVSWQEGPARAGGCAKAGSGLTRRGWDEVLQERRCGPALPITSHHPGLADSLRSVDPDDVQVAIVDTLLVLVGEARTAPCTVVHRTPFGRLLPRPTWFLLLPRASGTRTLHCGSGHSLLDVPLRSVCRGGPGRAAPASVPRLGARHQSCRRQIEGLLSVQTAPPHTHTYHSQKPGGRGQPNFLQSLQASCTFCKVSKLCHTF